MYNLSVELPSVEWSTVPGARSRGFNLKQNRLEEDDNYETRVHKFFAQLVEQLKGLGMVGSFAVCHWSGREVKREKIA
jgi:hypothetical protein